MSNARQHTVSSQNNKEIPLCVDLDDSLIRTDVLWEVVVQLFSRPLVALFALIALLGGGKAAFKRVLAEAIPIDPEAFPYREDVVSFIKAEHARGREIVLATATHRAWAEPIADRLGVFGRVFATEGGINLSGARKRDALVSAFGDAGFDYIGDHLKDLPIFSAARGAILVNPSRELLRKTSEQGNVLRVFQDDDGAGIRVIARALRLHQWAKNVLLAVPLLTAHLVLVPQAWLSVAIAFVAFGLVASATYLINDLLDLRSDRLHRKKRDRPLASGRLSIRSGLVLALGLGVTGFIISTSMAPPVFSAYLIAYLITTLLYSLYLKRRLLVDALTLAVLYSLRILAGGAAVGVAVSEWLLMFSLFLFLSLAFLKRIIELQVAANDAPIAGRGYSAIDIETVRVIGVSSGLIAVLVLSLYISSPAVSLLYRSPQILWLLCPVAIYWIARIWFLAARNEVHHDPVVFALFDWRSYIVGACGLLIVLFAKLSHITFR